MFQYGQLGNALFQVEHQHSDGSWGALEREEGEEHHATSAHDPERDWNRGHIYLCRSCGEKVRVSLPEADGSAATTGGETGA